jgi:hypothetical protein
MIAALLAKQLATLLFKARDFLQNRLYILTLLFKGTAAFFQDFNEPLKLYPVTGRSVVHIDQFANFRKGQAQTFAAQRELEPHAIAIPVYPASARPLRRQQSLVFVKADRPGRQSEFPRQICNRVCNLAHPRAVYVNVK